MTRSIEQIVEHAATTKLTLGEVIEVLDSGAVLVSLDGETPIVMQCQRLTTTAAEPLMLAAGDRVLTFITPDRGVAVVMGRIDASCAPPREPSSTEAVPETLVLEARQSLTLRVGEGSITLREDGKILIKGKDLVSHAQRMNRIKGGAVSIN